jgi:hypothetical protein
MPHQIFEVELKYERLVSGEGGYPPEIDLLLKFEERERKRGKILLKCKV